VTFPDRDFCGKGGTTILQRALQESSSTFSHGLESFVCSQPSLNYVFGGILLDQHFIDKHLSLNIRISLSFGGIVSILYV